MAGSYFSIRCTMADAQKSVVTVNVSRSPLAKTADMAIQHLTEIVGYADNKPVTRYHWRDGETGEYTNILTAEKIRDEPFAMGLNDIKHINAIGDAPPPAEKEKVEA